MVLVFLMQSKYAGKKRDAEEAPLTGRSMMMKMGLDSLTLVNC